MFEVSMGNEKGCGKKSRVTTNTHYMGVALESGGWRLVEQSCIPFKLDTLSLRTPWAIMRVES